jgi:hypothetical protein
MSRHSFSAAPPEKKIKYKQPYFHYTPLKSALSHPDSFGRKLELSTAVQLLSYDHPIPIQILVAAF